MILPSLSMDNGLRRGRSKMKLDVVFHTNLDRTRRIHIGSFMSLLVVLFLGLLSSSMVGKFLSSCQDLGSKFPLLEIMQDIEAQFRGLDPTANFTPDTWATNMYIHYIFNSRAFAA